MNALAEPSEARPRLRPRLRRRTTGPRPALVIGAIAVVLALAAAAAVGYTLWHAAQPVVPAHLPSDPRQALAVMERVTSEHPDSAEAWYRRAVIERALGDVSRAADHLTEAARLAPAERRYADELARTLLVAGKGVEAGEIWTALAGASKGAASERAATLVLAAKAFAQAGARDRAREAAERAADLDPGNEMALGLLKDLK